MKNKYLEQAMMELDDDLIAAAARPVGKTSGLRWTRVALIAACAAALLTGTALAGYQAWKATYRTDAYGGLVLELQQPEEMPVKEKEEYAALEKIYLPEEFPGEAVMLHAEKSGGDHILSGYEWVWQINDTDLLRFKQLRPGYYQRCNWRSRYTGVVHTAGETQMGGMEVSYVTTRMNDKIRDH